MSNYSSPGGDARLHRRLHVSHLRILDGLISDLVIEDS